MKSLKLHSNYAVKQDLKFMSDQFSLLLLDTHIRPKSRYAYLFFKINVTIPLGYTESKSVIRVETAYH